MLYRVPEARACQTATELRVDQTPDTIILYTEVTPFPLPHYLYFSCARGQRSEEDGLKNKVNDLL